MTTRQKSLRAAFATAFVLAAGISYAVVAPQRAAHRAKPPAVLLPTIVVHPDLDTATVAETAAVAARDATARHL